VYLGCVLDAFVRKRNSEEIEVSKLLSSFQILVLFYLLYFSFCFVSCSFIFFTCVRGDELFCFILRCCCSFFFQNKLTFGFTSCFTFRS